MSGICSKCDGCTRYFGKVVLDPIFGTTMTYDCAEDCSYYRAEQEAKRAAQEAKEAEEKAQAEAKRQQELEELCRNFEANAVEPTWASKEFPRQYALGYKFREIGNIFGWTKDKNTIIGRGFVPTIPEFQA